MTQSGYNRAELGSIQETEARPLSDARVAANGRKRIAFVHNSARYLGLHYIELIEEYLAKGWDVFCVCPDEPHGKRWSADVSFRNVTLDRRSVNPFKELSVVYQLYRVFREERPDVIVNFSIKPVIYGAVAAKWASIASVYAMITGLGHSFLAGGRFGRMLSFAVTSSYTLTLPLNRLVFFQNPDDCDLFVAKGMMSREKACILPGPGVDIDHYVPSGDLCKEGHVTFLMVARLIYDKGVREFAAAAERVAAKAPGLRCALLGPYDDNPTAIDEAEVSTWTDRGTLEYLGATDDVRAVLTEYDVFVLPSYREGLSRSALEAMAMGKPVVTTDVPGCRETVQDGINGFLVPARDSEALAEAMLRFVEQPALVMSMGEASRRIAKSRFDVRRVNRQIMNEIDHG